MELQSYSWARVDGAHNNRNSQNINDVVLQCTTLTENYLVAHYDLNPPDTPVYDFSGNKLIIYEPFGHMIHGESLEVS